MRPIARRTTCIKLPDPCAFCGGDVYYGTEDGTICIDCHREPPVCPACGVVCGESVEHDAPSEVRG